MSIDHGALVEVVQALVRVPSVYEPSTGRSEEGAARLVAHQLRDFGWTPEMDPVAPGRPNVYAVVEGGRPGPTLMFEGHTDVVTEGDPDAWTTDPFGADIRDGRLYGRGSADMKSGLVAALFATRAVADEGPFPGRIVLAALVDEEGMMAGARHFVSTGRAAGIDAAICCEPEDGEVCNVSKGAVAAPRGLHRCHGPRRHALPGPQPEPGAGLLPQPPHRRRARPAGPTSRAPAPRSGAPDPHRAAGRPSGPDERHPGRCQRVAGRADDPGRRSRGRGLHGRRAGPGGGPGRRGRRVGGAHR